MNSIFEKLSKYGFHDTELSSIDFDKTTVTLNFKDGLYLLDTNGKELTKTKPLHVIIYFDKEFESLDEVFDFREFQKRRGYRIDYLSFSKYLRQETYEICDVFYSNFSKSLLFDGGFCKRDIVFTIEEITDIVFCEIAE